MRVDMLSSAPNSSPDIQQGAILEKRRKLCENAGKFLENIQQFQLNGKDLRALQLEAAVAFEAWLKLVAPNEDSAMGRVVAPPGIGKTATAVLLSQMAGGKAVYFTYTKTLGDDAYREYRNHQATLPKEQQSTVGRCYGGHFETKADVVIGHFSGWEKWGEKIDWSQIQVIFADEADVNALSHMRADILEDLASKYGIPVIALSATEYQGGGRKLADVFPDEILHMPVPQTLPRLRELELIPHMRFRDLVFDCSLAIDAHQGGEIEELTLQDFIRSTAWNTKILLEYKALCEDASKKLKGVVVFRNNLMVADFVEQAHHEGVKAAAFVGTESDDELSALKDALATGQLDLLVGSKLLQRGFNELGLELVINSTLTRSPQVFWQTNGRGMRFDPAEPEREVEVLVVVPKMIVDKRDGRELSPYHRPLCNAAFFDREYFPPAKALRDPQAVLLPKAQGVLSLQLPDIEYIRSIDEVIKLIGDYRRKPPDFVGKPRQVAEAICSLQELTALNLARVLRIPPRRRQEMGMAREGKAVLQEIMPYDWDDQITNREETKILKDYLEGKNAPIGSEERRNSEQALLQILKTHEPIARAFARAMAPDPSFEDDFAQEARLQMISAFETFDLEKFRGRLVNFFIKGVFWRLERYKLQVSGQTRVPPNVNDRIVKISPVCEDYFLQHGHSPPLEVFAELARGGDKKFGPETIRIMYRLLFEKHQTFDAQDHEESICEVGVDEFSSHDHQLQLSEKINEALLDLSYRVREVLRLRFGMVREGGLTLEEVGNLFGLSRERVRQLENQGLESLSKEPYRPILEKFLELD